MTVLAGKSKAEIGSPTYRILLGLVFVSDVPLLEKSDDILYLYQHLNQLISHHR